MYAHIYITNEPFPNGSQSYTVTVTVFEIIETSLPVNFCWLLYVDRNETEPLQCTKPAVPMYMYLHRPEHMMSPDVPGPVLDRAHRNRMFVFLGGCVDGV